MYSGLLETVFVIAKKIQNFSSNPPYSIQFLISGLSNVA